jgi:hypothetical protein
MRFASNLVLDVASSVKYVFPLLIDIIFFDLHVQHTPYNQDISFNKICDEDQPNTKRNHTNNPLEVPIGPITRAREKKLNDMIQVRSNSDFDVKSAFIQFYSNRHNSQSDRWIGLKFYVESSDILSYIRLKFQVNQSWEGISIQVNRGYMNFVIYFLLTCGLPIWLGFFS